MLEQWIDRMLPGTSSDPLAFRLIIAIVGGLGAWVSSAWVAAPDVFRTLVLMMLADIAMGLLVAAREGHFQSRSLLYGALAKVGVLIALGALNEATRSLNVPAAGAMAIVFIARELGSIYELLARMYPLPKTILAPIRNVVQSMVQGDDQPGKAAPRG